MADISSRIQHAIEEMTGNEALLGMLDTDAAIEMLNWGKSVATSVVKQTENLDDIAADLALLPRLKAVRQSMRSVGNWAAGKYVDPADRIQLRDKLLQHFATIWGDEAKLPTAGELDAVLNEADDANNTPSQLIARLKTLLPDSM